ncbi:hypothetical protein ACJX0J_017260, partial [Zea mays]
ATSYKYVGGLICTFFTVRSDLLKIFSWSGIFLVNIRNAMIFASLVKKKSTEDDRIDDQRADKNSCAEAPL